MPHLRAGARFPPRRIEVGALEGEKSGEKTEPLKDRYAAWISRKIDKDSSFVDANILVYAAVKHDPRNTPSKALLKDPSRVTLRISPQIVAEFYSTITSPKPVTAPYAPLEAVEFIETLLEYDHVFVLPISQDVTVRLVALLKSRPVRGPHVFDLQIVATMLAHGVTRHFTYNVADFEQFTDLDLSSLHTWRSFRKFGSRCFARLRTQPATVRYGTLDFSNILEHPQAYRTCSSVARSNRS